MADATIAEPHRVALPDRFWKYVYPEPNSGCWLWGGYCVRQYGAIHMGSAKTRKVTRAHRLSYEAFVGTIPPGYEIDHLCRVVLCVNPAHLEAVTGAENRRRELRHRPRMAAVAFQRNKTACPRGHAYDQLVTVRRRDGRVLVSRHCRRCDNANQTRRRWERLARAL